MSAPSQFVLNPAACPECKGTQHKVSMLSAPQVTPDGSIGIAFAFKVEHCAKCGGTGLASSPAVVLNPSLR